MELQRRLMVSRKSSSSALARLNIADEIEKVKQKRKQVISKIEESVTEAKEVVKEKTAEVKKEIEFATNKAKDTVTRHSLLITNAVIEGQNIEEYLAVFEVIGKSKETIAYVFELARALGLKSTQIVGVIRPLKDFDFSTNDIIHIPPADFKAIYEVLKLGELKENIGINKAYEILAPVRERMTSWYNDAVTLLKVKTACDPTDLDEILYEYVKRSAEPIADTNALVIRILKFILYKVAHIPLPRLNTIYLSVLWYVMLSDMMQKAEVRVENLAPVAFTLTASMMLHLGKQTVSDVVSLMIDETSKQADSILRRLNIEEEERTQFPDEFRSWKSVVAILLYKASLETEDTMRVLSTYSIGKSFVRIITLKPSPKIFFNEILALPTKSFTDDIITFLRDYSDFDSRLSSMLEKRLASITETTTDEKRRELAYWAYMDGFKLWIAHSSEKDVENGEYYYDPISKRIQKDVFNKVSNSFSDNSDLDVFRLDLTILIVKGVEGKDPEEKEQKSNTLIKNLNHLMTLLYGLALLGDIIEGIIGSNENTVQVVNNALSRLPSNDSEIPILSDNDKLIVKQYDGITFGASKKDIKDKMEVKKRELRGAAEKVETYTKELKNFKHSKTYISNSNQTIKDSIKKVNEIAKELGKLNKDLSSK